VSHKQAIVVRDTMDCIAVDNGLRHSGKIRLHKGISGKAFEQRRERPKRRLEAVSYVLHVVSR